MVPFEKISSGMMGFIMIWMLLIVMLMIMVVVFNVHRRRRPLVIMLSITGAIVNHIIMMTMVYIADPVKYSEVQDWHIVRLLAVIPVISFIIYMLIMSGVVCFSVYSTRRWRKNHITHMSIKEGVDRIRAGICCYRPGGMPVMINPTMDELSYRLTGHFLMNGELLWNDLQNNSLVDGCNVLQTGDTIIVEEGDGSIKKIVHDEISIEDETLYQIISTDITELYRATLEMRQENVRLSDMNDRMRSLNETVTRVTIEREDLNAKIRIHDSLGQALLAAKRYLVSGNDISGNLLELWKGSIDMLKNEEPLTVRDDYQLMERTASDIGIQLIVNGALPQDVTRKRIISTAMHECMTNTIRHAGGDKVYVDVEPNPSFGAGSLVITFKNNGRAPEEEIHLSGGLLNLESMVRNSGGDMQVDTGDGFRLRLYL